MKKRFLLATFIATLCLAIIALSGFRYFQKDLFYYAFNEKIFLETVPNKFILRFTGSDIAKTKLNALEKTGLLKARDWKDERTVVVNFLKAATDKVIGELQEETDIVSVQPLYTLKGGNTEIAATDEILVRFKKNIDNDEIDRTIRIFNLQLKEKGELFYTFTVANSANTLAIANVIMESGVAEFSNPNFYRRIEMFQVPNDTYFGYQWNLHNTGQTINDFHTGTPGADIKAPEAWPITMGSSSVIVAVIDQGVTSNHPDLPNTRQVRLPGSNFLPAVPNNDPSPDGYSNHGNACAGIIAATRNNNEGIAGIAPNCKIMPIKISNDATFASDAHVANAITFAKNNGAQVISNSWGYVVRNSDGTAVEPSPNLIPAIVTAINDAVTTGRGGLGCVVAFAASNSANHVMFSNGIVSFPANVNIPGVLTVGASDRYDRQANYSPSTDLASPNNQVIDIVAPSHRAYPCQIDHESYEIWSLDIPGTSGYNSWHGVGDCNVNPPELGETFPSSGTNYLSYTARMGGTSAACPQVAAAAALLLSLNPNLTQQQVFNILTQNADKVGGYAYNPSTGYSNELGYGRLNLYRAVLKAGADLYMQDQTTDSGIEPNPSTAAYYASPDIWVRNNNDGGTVHQNPEAGQTNYVYVKVRNRGNIASSAIGNNLKVYWAAASAGLSWTYPWTGAIYFCSNNLVPVGGQIGSAQTIPSISSGGSTTLVFAWNPPKPTDYPCFDNSGHFCLLARIETRNASPYGMAFPETSYLGDNVQKNNNIVWKNVSIVNLLPDMHLVRTSVLIAGAKLLSKSFQTTNITFNIPNEKGNNNILNVANVDIDLDGFTDAWLKGGGKVDSGKVYKDKNGKTLIRLTGTKGTIYGVPIASTQIGSITLAITPLKFSAKLLYLFDIQQMDKATAIGGERFDIRFVQQTQGATPVAKAVPTTNNIQIPKKNEQLKAYQTGKQLNIVMNDGKEYIVTIVNSIGQVLTTTKMINQKAVPINNFLQGIYYIKLINAKEQKTISTSVMIQ
jgi:subtilisin family serine protease